AQVVRRLGVHHLRPLGEGRDRLLLAAGVAGPAAASGAVAAEAPEPRRETLAAGGRGFFEREHTRADDGIEEPRRLQRDDDEEQDGDQPTTHGPGPPFVARPLTAAVTPRLSGAWRPSAASPR